MPSLSFDLNITANTPKATASPVEKKAYVGPCKIIGATVQFPAGCQYQAKIQLGVSVPGNAKMPILPASAGGDSLDYIALDDFVQFFKMSVDVNAPSIIYADGWNEDVSNAHEIKIVVLTEVK